MKTKTLDNFIRDVASLVDDPEAKRSYTKLLRITLNEFEAMALNVIPNVKTEFFTVNDNNIVDLPSDTIAPIQAARYEEVGGTGVVYPLGQKGAGYEVAMKPRDGFQCAPDDLESTDVVFTYQNYNNSNLNLQYGNWYYGQSYGYHPNRVFGMWSFDEEWSRMIFETGHIQPGQKVIVKYTTLDKNYKVIPVDIIPMLTYRVLEKYYLNANPQKSQLNMRMFKMEYTRYKRNTQHFTPNDYILAFNRGYNDGIK